MSDQQFGGICQQCGNEIRGEVCEACYTEEDQSFDSYKPGEQITRNFIIFVATSLMSVAYLGSYVEFGKDNEIITAGTKFFVLIAIYSLYMTCVYTLVAMGKISNERAKRLDPFSKENVSSYFKKKH